MDFDIQNVANSYMSVKQGEVQRTVQTKLLNISMDTQAKEAQDLLNTLPKKSSQSNLSDLGRNLDLYL